MTITPRIAKRRELGPQQRRSHRRLGNAERGLVLETWARRGFDQLGDLIWSKDPRQLPRARVHILQASVAHGDRMLVACGSGDVRRRGSYCA